MTFDQELLKLCIQDRIQLQKSMKRVMIILNDKEAVNFLKDFSENVIEIKGNNIYTQMNEIYVYLEEKCGCVEFPHYISIIDKYYTLGVWLRSFLS